MNFEKAREAISNAKNKKLKTLYLSSKLNTGKLNSKDLTVLAPEIKEIEQLDTLYLADNNLTDISFLSEFAFLTSLNLEGNNLSDITPLKNFKNLKKLFLNGNKLLEQKFRRRYLFENIDRPQAILEQYFDWEEAKKNNTLTPLNEAKIILIGQGNVGKSSLRISLTEGKCSHKQKKTEGLEIVEWDLVVENDRKIKFNIWDFGGQEIYHTTHQYFFDSECLYILVTDYSGRVEWRTNRLGYWLKTIQMLAKEENDNHKPVVVIVGNKADERGDYKISEEAIENELEKAREKYEDLEIVGFFPISCHEGENIHSTSAQDKKSLVDVIKEQLPKIGVDRNIPQKYVDYKAEIIKSGKDFISVDEFSAYCPNKTELMRIIFHSIGIITAFCENHKIKSEKLKNLIVFNSEWITKGIYKILSANHLLEINNGIASEEELRGLLNENKYPSLDDIIEMMKEFYICRSKLVDDSQGNQIEKYFFPKFYSNKTPAFVQSFKSDCLETQIEYRYDYSFISDNIIAFFIIKAEDKFNHTDFWKDGGFIVEGNDKALVEADDEDNSITITTKGENAEDLLRRIKIIFDEIHKMDFIPKPKNEIKINRSEESQIKTEVKILREELNVANIRIDKLEKERVTFMIQNNQANSSQVGAMGNKNEIRENTFNQQINTETIDFQKLSAELFLLKKALEEKATTVEDGKAIVKVENAIDASEEQDENKVAKYLKEGGKFVLETAKEVAANVITELITK